MNFFMLPIMMCAKGSQTFASSGGVTFFWCLCCLATIFNAGSVSVFTVWPARRCRVRKLPTVSVHTLSTACMATNPAPFSRISTATSTGRFPSRHDLSCQIVCRRQRCRLARSSWKTDRCCPGGPWLVGSCAVWCGL